MNCRNAVTRRSLCLAAALSLAGLLGGCTTTWGAEKPFIAASPNAQQDALQGLAPTDVWLLGEQHDAPAHQARQRALLEALQIQGVLAALVIEMAERGGSTQGLPPGATDAQVQQALHWPDSQAAGWDWAVYGPMVMQAVRAQIPVLGGNLPRAALRAAMQDAGLDQRMSSAAWLTQLANIREGHCQLLPETQVVPMTRVQIARDVSMAETIGTVLAPGKTVLLVAGNQHVRRDVGVPQHLDHGVRSTVVSMAAGDDDSAASTAADQVWRTAPVRAQDHCAAFKAQMKP